MNIDQQYLTEEIENVQHEIELCHKRVTALKHTQARNPHWSYFNKLAEGMNTIDDLIEQWESITDYMEQTVLHDLMAKLIKANEKAEKMSQTVMELNI